MKMQPQDFCCITELVILSSPNIIGLPVIPVSINFGTSEGRGRGESIPVLSVGLKKLIFGPILHLSLIFLVKGQITMEINVLSLHGSFILCACRA